MKKLIALLEENVKSWWYLPTVFLLLAVDPVILIVPSDTLVVLTATFRKSRWVLLSIFLALGSTLGALLFLEIFQLAPLDFANYSQEWPRTMNWAKDYGLLTSFFFALSPLPYQPAIAGSLIAGVNEWEICSAVLLGRIIKYWILSFVAVRAPRFVRKMKWVFFREKNPPQEP